MEYSQPSDRELMLHSISCYNESEPDIGTLFLTNRRLIFFLISDNANRSEMTELRDVEQLRIRPVGKFKTIIISLSNGSQSKYLWQRDGEYPLEAFIHTANLAAQHAKINNGAIVMPAGRSSTNGEIMDMLRGLIENSLELAKNIGLETVDVNLAEALKSLETYG